ncbi:MGT2 magnesium transporter, partial [Trypanosoma conorhini]
MQSDSTEFSPLKCPTQAAPHCTVVLQANGAPATVQHFPSSKELRNFLQKEVSTTENGCVWVDMQGCTEEQNRMVLQLLFPQMEPSQMEDVLRPEAQDAVELQPVKGEYLIGGIACACAQRRCALDTEDDDNTVVCSFACNEHFLLTMHAVPFLGLAEVLHQVKVGGSRFVQESLPEVRELEANNMLTVRASGVLCALVCFTCETYLPNPTGLISEVDCIDEMVMLVAPGKRDQSDLLRRIAVLRRRMSTENARLYLKEKLLQELMGPTMRTTFVSRDLGAVRAYREAFVELSQVLERMEVARDALNHVNLNFVNAVSMRMSQASAGFDYRMMVISQITT